MPPAPLTDLVVAITPDRAAGVLRIRAEAATTGPTGVEMEAMTAASVAALTVYDMVKGVERGVEIRAIRLVSKTGGKSGEWHRPPSGEAARSTAEPQARRPDAGRIGEARGQAEPMTGPSDRIRARPHASATGAPPAREDASGAALAARLAELGYAVERRVVPDERWEIEEALVAGPRRAPPRRDHRRDGPDAA